MSDAATERDFVPVPHHRKDEHYEAAVKARRKEEKRERRFGAAKSLALAGLLAYAAFLSWENRTLTSLAASNANRVVYVTLRDDGALVNTAMYTSLPPKWQSDNRLNTLWNYVFWRECYSESEAPRAYYNVQRMSDDRVKREWIGHMSLDNPNSPRNKVGKKRHYYTCEPVGYAPVGSEDNRFVFRFKRYEHDNQGRRDEGIMMHVPVAFRTGVYPKDEDAWIDKTVFNAPGVQVWEYPGARPDALQDHLQSRTDGGQQRPANWRGQ